MKLRCPRRAVIAGSRGAVLSLVALQACAKPAPPPESPPPAAPAVAAPAPTPPQAGTGSVATEQFHSEALGVDKHVVVYLPAGYDAAPATRWPVFYYLHGLGGNETNWVKHGQLDHAADRLGLAAIVVMPDGDDGFYVDSPATIDYDKCMADGTGLFDPNKPHAEQCVRARRYESYVANDLVGWVDAHYRTIQRRDGRAIAGLSMGGFGAMELSLRHPDEFAAAASHSGAIAMLFGGPRPFDPNKPVQLRTKIEPGGGPIVSWIATTIGPDLATWKAHDVVELATHLPPGKVALYIDCGTEDDFGLFDNAQYVHAALNARHIPHEFFLGPGRHNFDFWAARLPSSLAFLRDHTAKPEPASSSASHR